MNARLIATTRSLVRIAKFVADLLSTASARFSAIAANLHAKSVGASIARLDKQREAAWAAQNAATQRWHSLAAKHRALTTAAAEELAALGVSHPAVPAAQGALSL